MTGPEELQMHGGDRVAAVLKAQGVKTVFTLCGGHISPILTGARAAGIRVIDTRHEATAVFAADAALGGEDQEFRATECLWVPSHADILGPAEDGAAGRVPESVSASGMG